ncbi:sigma-70 family RNA polymerase sigma factor [Ruminococcus sp. CLA-AA-H200]|uniref:Sigma-70 family RNA polymerase sigma factor n=1 Tax=Ruminococcus turbiniformis TaxID=2881258 RepID=A0ABS8G294_9FIRM|nr:sigma-70 family RNA polymerase sigma factor [Ruminococcus turbiniformis]MCC2255964.1 sigma-70 family RNA polymerase sigma factor [Ruminococcus turbiniformis]
MEENRKENNTKKLTKEQVMFRDLLNVLRVLEKQDPPDMERINMIKMHLWNSISRFAVKEINRMMGKFSSREEREDVKQDLALIFFEKLPEYNPEESTPTTYYVRYFREKIAKYIRDYKVNLKQYDANNMRRINTAVSEFKTMGIPYSIDMIAARTGLSEKVIKATVVYATNAKLANVDEAYTLHSHALTPEEEAERAEAENILYEALAKEVTPEELTLIQLRINYAGKKELPYDKISDLTGIPIREVKATLNSAFCKLSQCKSLRSRFGNYNPYKKAITDVAVQDKGAETMQDQLCTFLTAL